MKLELESLLSDNYTTRVAFCVPILLKYSAFYSPKRRAMLYIIFTAIDTIDARESFFHPA